jgi:hypothetical protein
MPPLKATQAREINKADIIEAETLVFEGRVLRQTGKQTMEPDEFYFRPDNGSRDDAAGLVREVPRLETSQRVHDRPDDRHGLSLLLDADHDELGP